MSAGCALKFTCVDGYLTIHACEICLFHFAVIYVHTTKAIICSNTGYNRVEDVAQVYCNSLMILRTVNELAQRHDY